MEYQKLPDFAQNVDEISNESGEMTLNVFKLHTSWFRDHFYHKWGLLKRIHSKLIGKL